MESQTEEQCAQMVKLLPLTEAALLDWAVNLMADVAQLEHHNKMNSRNIAMVFAPNMTKVILINFHVIFMPSPSVSNDQRFQMADPLTALMHVVQLINLLKTLILRTLRERQEAVLATASVMSSSSQLFDDDDDQSGAQLPIDHTQQRSNQDEPEPVLEKKKKKKKKKKFSSYSSSQQTNHAKGTGQNATVTRKKSNSTASIVSLINPKIERAEAWR